MGTLCDIGPFLPFRLPLVRAASPEVTGAGFLGEGRSSRGAEEVADPATSVGLNGGPEVHRPAEEGVDMFSVLKRRKRVACAKVQRFASGNMRGRIVSDLRIAHRGRRGGPKEAGPDASASPKTREPQTAIDPSQKKLPRVASSFT